MVLANGMEWGKEAKSIGGYFALRRDEERPLPLAGPELDTFSIGKNWRTQENPTRDPEDEYNGDR